MDRRILGQVFLLALAVSWAATPASAQCAGGAGAQTGLAAVSCTGVAAWAGQAVASGGTVTYNNCLYKANQAVAANSSWCPGCAGIFLYGNGAACPAAGCNYGAQGTCGGSATPTPTSTNTAIATATARPTTRPTATATACGCSTPTATSRATATPRSTATSTATPTRTSTPTSTAPPTATPTQGTNTCSAPAWTSTAIFTAGQQAVARNYLWTAKYWTQNNPPVASAGNGPWKIAGFCGANPGAAGGRQFAPYVDVTMGYNLTSHAAQTGGHYTLAFIVGLNGSCQASWAGNTPLSSNLYVSDLASLRAAGGDVIISFGGAAGSELGNACGSAAAAQAQYQAVINQYHPMGVDFDIEGGGLSSTIRNAAVAGLQAANSGLKVSYTLPVLSEGLSDQVVSLLADAAAKGVKLTRVNVMAMDMGASYDNGAQMGLSSQLAGWSTMSQLEPIFPSASHAAIAAMVGITPMLGVNDTQPETFTLTDASNLVSWGHTQGVGLLSYWSETRDTPCAGGKTGWPADGACSGVTAAAGAYAQTMKAF